MLTPILASLMLAQTTVAPPTPAPTLAFRDGFFLITDASGTTKVNSRIWGKTRPTEFSLKSGAASVTWSNRALVVRSSAKAKPVTYRFSDFPTNPTYFTDDQLETLSSQVVLKSRTKEVSALSGWEVVGSNLFVLLRWEDRAGNPWAEGLFTADVSKVPIKFRPVAGGAKVFSLAETSIDDQLVSSGSSLVFVAEKDGDYGIASFDAGNTVFNFNPHWTQKPVITGWNPSRTNVGFVEKTRYNSNVIGHVGIAPNSRVNLAESRDPLSFPGDFFDIVMITRPDSVILRTAESGLELKLPSTVGVRNVAQGVLVWLPKTNPTTAALYTKTSLRAISKWAAVPAKTRAKKKTR